ncbi:MAG TPA: hypothetical protein PKH31_11865 [Candidatus Sumerlaeota bacterium]|nr:hypothetical protein [Candidatus Sumerlaeota bacterium]
MNNPLKQDRNRVGCTRMRAAAVGFLWILLGTVSMGVRAQTPASHEGTNPFNPFVLATEPVDAWMTLGPFPQNDSEQATPTLPADVLTETGAFRPDTFFWREGEPYTWFPVATASDGHLYLRQVVAPTRFRPRSEGRQAFYLYRAIQSPEPAERVLALSLPGETRVWLNGQPVEPGQTSGTATAASSPPFWSPPGEDCFLAVIQLQKGINHLLIESETPPQGTVWQIQARLVGRGAFNRGEVAYPRWQFSTRPPWTETGSPLQARWGDPAIEAYLKQPTHPIAVQIALASEAGGTPARMNTTMGQAFSLSLPEPTRTVALTLSANSLSTTATTEAALLSPLATTAYTLLIGDTSTLSVVKQARLFAESSRVPEPVRTRLRAMLALFDTTTAPEANPAGLNRILEGLLFLTDRIKAPKTIPESGWTVLDAQANQRLIPYALWIPRGESGSEPTSHPLLIALPSIEANAFDLIERHPALFQEAQRHQWLVAVPTQEPEETWDWSKREETLNAIRQDLASHFKLDPRLVCVLGFESAGEFAITYALSHRDAIAGVATLNVPWISGAPWKRLLENTVPRPILFLAASLPLGKDPAKAESFAPDPIVAALRNSYLQDGSWKRFVVDPKDPRTLYDTLFQHFEKRPLPPSPSRITLRLPDTGSTSAGWVRLRKASHEDQPATLSIASATTNSIEVEVQNVARFDLTFRNIPHLNPQRPVLLNIREKVENEQAQEVQKLRVFEPRKPDLIVVEQSSATLNQDNTPRWSARAAMAADKTSDSLAQTLATLETAASPLAAGSLFAHALRLQSNAEVSLVPALQIRNGLEKGALTVNQISSVLPDSNLARMSLPRPALARMLEHDYAGPRDLLTDGLTATIGTLDEETTPTTATLAVAAPTSASTSLWQTVPNGKSWLISPVFDQTLETVTVVGTRSALVLARGLCGLSAEASPIEDLSLGTHEAALRFFYQIRHVQPPSPDIRPPTQPASTVKKPLEYKTFPTKSSNSDRDETETKPSPRKTRSRSRNKAEAQQPAPEKPEGEAPPSAEPLPAPSRKTSDAPEPPVADAAEEDAKPDATPRKTGGSTRKILKFHYKAPEKTPEEEKAGKDRKEETAAAETPKEKSETGATPQEDKTSPTKRKARLKVQMSE